MQMQRRRCFSLFAYANADTNADANADVNADADANWNLFYFWI